MPATRFLSPDSLRNTIRTFSCRCLRRSVAALSLLVLCSPIRSAPVSDEVDVFTSGQDGYAIYRIPAVTVSSSGTLLAFCEGRKNGAGDSGAIDLVLRRSSNGGRDWSPLQVVWTDAGNTCGNPAPVVDRDTGRIWLFTTWNLGSDTEVKIHDGTSTDTRRVFVTYSDDDGQTWPPPREVTTDVKHADWRWYATGPGHAIQLADGRLVIPANHSRRNGRKNLTSSHVIVSDDHGRTWRHTEEAGGHTNESTVAELDNGHLYLNMRSYRGLNQRGVAWSEDRGETWSEVTNDPVLVEPVCQASVLRVRTQDGSSVHLFSNPASTKRRNMTVRASRDGCRTWNAGRVVYEGPSAYSDLFPLDDHSAGLLYERDGGGKPYGRITFARLPLDWLLAAPAVEAAVTTGTVTTAETGGTSPTL